MNENKINSVKQMNIMNMLIMHRSPSFAVFSISLKPKKLTIISITTIEMKVIPLRPKIMKFQGSPQLLTALI
jgi:hypothetical protein